MPLSTRRVQLCDPSDLALNPSEKGGARLALFDEPGDTKPFVRAYLVHRQMREGQIAKFLSEGTDTITELVRRMYTHLPKKMHGAAARSVQAHKEHMVETHRAVCVGPVTAESVFTPGPATE